MMKLFKEERTVLKTGKNKFKTFLLVVLLSEIISPQIPFKGFCKLNSFKVDSGYTKIFSFNYNQNEYSDLLIYDPARKSASILEGRSGIKFNSKDILLPTETSAIEPITLPANSVENFAVTSRKNRSFGIYKFSSSGNPALISQIKFNSYPDNISFSFNQTDNSQSFLISGNSFEGLSIVVFKNDKLEEKKILEKRVFKDAHFLDINSDGYDDIAALNSIDNRLHLLFNNSRGDFNEVRSIFIDKDVISMDVFDINYDGFKDIIVSTKSYLKIFFGDATASFNKTIIIQTTYSIDKFIIGDFNRDGYFDFNCLNIEEGIISTIFAKDFDMFYPEFVQKKQKGIIDVIPFFSKFIYGAAYLNKNGRVYVISSVASMSEDEKLALSIQPNLITSFDHIDNGIIDFAFTDNFDKKLKFILRNNAGLPEKLFAVKLYEDHNRILHFSNSKVQKTFYLYNAGEKIIEAIEIDFEKFSFTRRFHYSEGPIQDLIIRPDGKGDPELFILYSKNKTLNVQVITKTQINYNQKLYTNLASDWVKPFLFFDEKIMVGYWQYENNYLNLNYLEFTVKDSKTIEKLKLNPKNSILISKYNQTDKKDELKYSAFISTDEEIKLLLSKGDPKLYSIKGTKNGLRIQDKNQLFFGKTNSIFVYNSNLKGLIEYIPAKAGIELFVSEKFQNLDLTNYTIQKLDQRNYHLIFTNVKSGNIEIRKMSR